MSNVYRAFDFRDEERIYDVLERSVHGGLLTDIYLETRRGLEIRNQGDTTVLRVTHGDWRDATDFCASCNYQWGRYMQSLKSYCETGKGEPFCS